MSDAHRRSSRPGEGLTFSRPMDHMVSAMTRGVAFSPSPSTWEATSRMREICPSGTEEPRCSAFAMWGIRRVREAISDEVKSSRRAFHTWGDMGGGWAGSA